MEDDENPENDNSNESRKEQCRPSQIWTFQAEKASSETRIYQAWTTQ